MKQQQTPSIARIVRPSRATIQWNDPLDVALAHMNAMFQEELFVLAGDRLVGRIHRADIDICARKATGSAVLLSRTP